MSGRNDGLDIEPDDLDLEEREGDGGGEEGGNKDRGDNLEPEGSGEGDGGEKGAKPATAKATQPGDGEEEQISIPKARFDQVNTRRQLAEARAAQLEEENQRLKAGKATAPTEEQQQEQPLDLKALRKQRTEAMMEGDIDKVSELDEQIESEVERRAASKAMQAFEQREAQRAFEKAVREATNAYPFLDSTKEDKNPEAIAEVVEWRDFYINKGMSPAEALTKAVGKVGPQYAKADPEPKDDTSPGDQIAARRRAIIERNAKLSQPPPTTQTGTGERAERTKADAIEKMSDEDFEKLPAAEKKRLRGD